MHRPERADNWRGCRWRWESRVSNKWRLLERETGGLFECLWWSAQHVWSSTSLWQRIWLKLLHPFPSSFLMHVVSQSRHRAFDLADTHSHARTCVHFFFLSSRADLFWRTFVKLKLDKTDQKNSRCKQFKTPSLNPLQSKNPSNRTKTAYHMSLTLKCFTKLLQHGNWSKALLRLV